MGLRKQVKSFFDKQQRSSDVTITVKDKTNPKWSTTSRGSSITVKKAPIISSNSRVFTMGSCFAVEIRNALRQRQVQVFPRYLELSTDPKKEKIGKLPERDNVNHYDTFSIKQEFDRVLNGGENFPYLRLNEKEAKKHFPAGEPVQDPYRRDVFAVDLTAMEETDQKISGCIRAAIEQADVYIITLGLTEVWRDRETGLYVWSEKVRRRSPDMKRFEFIRSTFQENYDNVRWVCDLLAERYPDKKVILTVSPVPLARSFSGDDVVVANNYSKSLLRTVAGQLESELQNVYYWPSFEIASRMDVFEADGRHVTDEGVGFIVGNFLKAYSTIEPS